VALISVKDLSIGFSGPLLLDSVSFDIDSAERVCLVGRNGEGKSTLLRILAQKIQADSGDLVLKSGLKVVYLPQEFPVNLKGSVRSVILGDELERNSNKEAALGRTGLDFDVPYESLSGGQKRRVLIAKALGEAPDLLLLDEPTNHLDIASIQWLEDLLNRFEGALLFVSHDKAFVQQLSSRILELDRGKIRSWNCRFDEFLERREAEIEIENRANKLFDKKLAQEEIWIRKGIKARRTRNEGRVRSLKKMREERRARRDRTGSVSMHINEASLSGKIVARLQSVSYSYDEKILFENFSTEIVRGDRIGIVGENGSGKTTLVKVILGELQAKTGSVELGTNLEVAYFDQMRAALKEDLTLVENIGDTKEFVEIDGKRRHVLSYLQDFLFSSDRARGPISALSGGERNRLLLAILFSRPSNVLVLDEPTNDLDIETLELLTDLIAQYRGTVLLVSHDRSFLDATATTVFAIENGGHIQEIVGGYSEYAQFLKEKKSLLNETLSSKKLASTKSSKAKSKRAYHEEQEFQKLPEKIEALESQIESLHQELSLESVYTDATKLIALQEKLKLLDRELLEAYERFEFLDALGS